MMSARVHNATPASQASDPSSSRCCGPAPVFGRPGRNTVAVTDGDAESGVAVGMAVGADGVVGVGGGASVGDSGGGGVGKDCDGTVGMGDGGTAPVPLPLTTITCVLPSEGASSVTMSVAARLPLTVGVKVRLNWHCAPGARVVMQLVEGLEKSCASPPVFAIEVMVRYPAPVFVTTTNCEPLVVFTACEPKLIVVGEKLMPRLVTAVGVVTVATPLKSTNCGLPVTESSRKSRVVERLPRTFRPGEKRTTTVQDDPGARGRRYHSYSARSRSH
jgi:hypothetical protein